MDVAGLAIPLVQTLFGLNDQLRKIRYAPMDINLFRSQTNTLTGLITLFKSQYPDSVQTLDTDQPQQEEALAKDLFEQFAIVVRLADAATGAILRIFVDAEGAAWQLVARCKWVFKKPMADEARLAMVVFSTSFHLYLLLTKLGALQREVDILRAQNKMPPPELEENLLLYQEVVTTERRQCGAVRQQFIAMAKRTRQPALITEEELDALLKVARSIETKADGVIETFPGRRRSARRRPRPRRPPSNPPADAPPARRQARWPHSLGVVYSSQAVPRSVSDPHLPSQSGAAPRRPRPRQRQKAKDKTPRPLQPFDPREEPAGADEAIVMPNEPSVPLTPTALAPMGDPYAEWLAVGQDIIVKDQPSPKVVAEGTSKEPPIAETSSKPSGDGQPKTSIPEASSSKQKTDQKAARVSEVPLSESKKRFRAVPPFDNKADLESLARRRAKARRPTVETDDEGSKPET